MFVLRLKKQQQQQKKQEQINERNASENGVDPTLIAIEF